MLGIMGKFTLPEIVGTCTLPGLMGKLMLPGTMGKFTLPGIWENVHCQGLWESLHCRGLWERLRCRELWERTCSCLSGLCVITQYKVTNKVNCNGCAYRARIERRREHLEMQERPTSPCFPLLTVNVLRDKWTEPADRELHILSQSLSSCPSVLLCLEDTVYLGDIYYLGS